MEKIEVSGRTLEEALQVAAQQLGVGVDAVEYELVEEGGKGFLGLGQTPTVLTAWVGEGAKPVAPPVREAEFQALTEMAEEEAERAEAAAAAQDEPMEAEPGNRAIPTAGEDEFVDRVMSALADILKAMDLDARPQLRSADPEEVTVDLVGSDGAILIGRHGQTLDALQYLIGLIASKHAPTRRRVILDAENYRDRHRELLERKAFEYAKAVKEEGKEAVLEPQNARDRRIIHVTLAENPDVYTYSEGEGDDRHVVISPRK